LYPSPDALETASKKLSQRPNPDVANMSWSGFKKNVCCLEVRI
jgi:hypothetical protein